MAIFLPLMATEAVAGGLGWAKSRTLERIERYERARDE